MTEHKEVLERGRGKLKEGSVINSVGRDGALVEAITLNRRVVGSTPALAVT